MDGALIGGIGAGIALVLVLLRIPVAIAMGVMALAGIAAITNIHVAIGVLRTVPFELIGDWNLSAVPMFLLMGYIALAAGLTRGIFKVAQIFLQRIPGGLAISTIIGCGFFSAANGSSIATAATFARIAIPEMTRVKYSSSFAAGTVAAGGTLGALIPPSILLIVYGLIMSTSIDGLFMAGILPGILSATVFIAYIYVRVKINPSIAPITEIEYSAQEKLDAIRESWPIPTIIIFVLGGIFAGIFTATEAGAVGAAITCGIALQRRQLSWRTFRGALIDTVTGTAALFIIVIAAALFQRFLGISGVAEAFGQFVTAHIDSQLGVILAIVILYIILGCFLDGISILLLTLPILMPIIHIYDINEIWFAIIAVKLLEIGLITPPVGMNMFVIKSAMGPSISLNSIYKGSFGFLIADLITLALLISFPIISLWIPEMSR